MRTLSGLGTPGRPVAGAGAHSTSRSEHPGRVCIPLGGELELGARGTDAGRRPHRRPGAQVHNASARGPPFIEGRRKAPRLHPYS